MRKFADRAVQSLMTNAGPRALCCALACLGWLACTPSSSAPTSGSGGKGGTSAKTGSGGEGGASAGAGGGQSSGGSGPGTGGEGAGSGGSGPGNGGSGAGTGGDGGSNGGLAGSGGGAGGSSGGSTAGGTSGGGGASRDASVASESGVPDAPVSGSSAACAGVATKFCEDFEAQTVGMPPAGDFVVDAKAGALVVDGTKPYDGTKSLHIKMAQPAARAMMDFTKQFPFDDLHGRAMFYVTKVPTSDIHWDFLYSYNTAPNEWELGGQFGGFSLVLDPPDHPVYSKNKIPLGRWFCVQWDFKYAGPGADNTYSAKIDGAVIDKGEWTGADPSGRKWPAAPWKNFSIGWEGYGDSNVDIEIWIDDLAFGEQAIDCPKAT